MPTRARSPRTKRHPTTPGGDPPAAALVTTILPMTSAQDAYRSASASASKRRPAPSSFVRAMRRHAVDPETLRITVNLVRPLLTQPTSETAHRQADW
jgi:hypothetical protein